MKLCFIPRKRLGAAMLFAMLSLIDYAPVAAAPVMAPTVVAVPYAGELMRKFYVDEATCRAYAQHWVDTLPNGWDPVRLQARYNRFYTRCMVSRGYEVHGAVTAYVPAPPAIAVVPMPPPVAVVPMFRPRPGVVFVP